VGAAHLIYIPGCVLIGIALGFVLGSRAARDVYEAEQRRKQGKKRAPEP